MLAKGRGILSSGFIIILFLFQGIGAFSSVQIKIDLGFEGHYQVNKWLPLSILFTNEGPLVKGNLLIKWEKNKSLSKKPTQISYFIPVSLPPSSKKLYTTNFLIESEMSSLHFLLLQGEKIVLKKDILLKPLYRKQGLILAINKKDSGLDFLNQLSEGKERRVFYVKVKDLPYQWIGYDGVDILIIDDVSSINLEDNQREALKKWLSVGGTLVVTARGDYGKFTSPLFLHLLPVEIKGKVNLSPPFSFLEENLEGGSGNLEVWKIYSPQGEVKIKEKNIPLLIRFKKGEGQVFFLTADFSLPPFRDWPGRWKIWEQMIEEKRLVSLPRGMLNGIIESLFLVQKPSYPSRERFLLFLGIYLLALGIFYFIYRKKFSEKWKHRSIFLFLIIIFFFLSSYLLFGYKIEEENNFLKEISIYYKSGESSSARAESYFLLFSSREDNFKLETQAETSFVSGLSGKSEKIHKDLEFLFSDEKMFFSFSAKPWSLYSFRVETISEFPLIGKAEKKGSSFKIALKNLNFFPLEDILVIYKEKYLFLKKLFPLSERELNFNSGEGENMDISSLCQEKREIINQIFKYKKIKELSLENPLLIGWFRESPRSTVKIEERISRKFRGLILMPLPLNK